MIQERLFPDYARIRRIPQRLDVINLGSNPAKYGIDYEGCDVKGYNLAVGPQTIEYDFKVLKNYHSYFNDKGPKLLLLLFCPFSLCKNRYTERDGEICHDLRYYLILHHAMINDYDESIYRQLKYCPERYLLSSFSRIRSFVAGSLSKRYRESKNRYTEDEMNLSARNYLELWRREFELKSFEVEELPSDVKKAIEKNAMILDEIIAFVAERSIRPVIVLPPISPNLSSLIPQQFKDFCFYSVLRETGIPILDFTDDREFAKHENFVDALCLNASGRKKFTKHLIETLKNKKIL